MLPDEEFAVLQESREDAADLLDLREVKVAEACAETVTLSEAKKQLGLD